MRKALIILVGIAGGALIGLGAFFPMFRCPGAPAGDHLFADVI
jgi:hypothetical protein